ncbi:MAG: thioesterase family protein [Bacteroidota bacterium]|nr:thioesterase family protein [Bacteroidota bacterium]
MKEYQHTTRVRYAETDKMGVVYHANYAIYFEIGRVEWLRNRGISYKEMEEQGIMLPVVSLSMSYKKSAYYDDLLTIVTRLKNLNAIRIEFEYEILNQHNELLTTGETTLVFINSQTKRPTPAPKHILSKLEQ